MKTVSAPIVFLLGLFLLTASWMFTNNNQADAGFADGWPDLVATPGYARWESYAD
ncbi:MAG: hypothetical protein WC911_08000 [Thermoleophilia bacterium]